MEQRSRLQVLNSGDQSTTVVVEPWANEHQVPPNSELTLVAIHPNVVPYFGVERFEKGLVVWVQESGSTYEAWRGSDMLYRTDNAIPQVP